MAPLDDYMVVPGLSLLDKARRQAQVLVPVIRALRAELGEEKALSLMKGALREWSLRLFQAISEEVGGSPRRKWAALNSALTEVSVRDLTFDMKRQDKEALEFDVTSCRFAEFFRALDEPELGTLLVCDADYDIAAAGEGEVSFERAQTLMQDAPSCTFRYRFAPRR